MTTIDELRTFKAKLAEVERLPQMEAEAAAEARRQQTTQQLNRDVSALEDLAGQYHLVEAEITAGLQGMIDQIDRTLADLLRLKHLHNRAKDDLAQRIGQARCQLGQQTIKHSGVITQNDVDHEAGIALERNGLTGQSRLANVGRTLVVLRQQLTDPPPPDITAGKVLIKTTTAGQDNYHWG